MTVPVLPNLSLGISPSSSASAQTGLKMLDTIGGATTGEINVGSAGGETWVSGLVRDFVIGVAVALAAKWAWGKIK